MYGKTYDPRLIFSWPTAKMAVMDGEIAANTILSTKKNINDEEREMLKSEIFKKYEKETSPYFSAARLVTDNIIDPRNTRDCLIKGLEIASNNPNTGEFRTGVMRM